MSYFTRNGSIIGGSYSAPSSSIIDLNTNYNIKLPKVIATATSSPANGVSVATTTMTVNKPTGTEVDDLILFFYSYGSSGAAAGTITSTYPTGWSRLRTTTAPIVEIWYKVAGASEPASYDWIRSSGSNGRVLGNITIRNARFIEYSSIQNDNVATGFNSTENGILLAHYSYGSITSGITISSGPAEMTQQYFVRNNDAVINYIGSALYSQEASLYQATGNKTITWSTGAVTNDKATLVKVF